MAQLVVDDIHMRFAGVVALQGVSLSVNQGEIFSLVGPNGSGKSTLFNCINGFHRPQKGNITYQSHDLLNCRPHAMAQWGIARTFQNLQNIPYATVLDNVLLGAHIHFSLPDILRRSVSRKEREREEALALEIMAFLGLVNYEQRILGSQPYGIQKLVELARALVSRPKLLLLDEPAAGMNEQETLEMAKIISEIREDFGITVLVVEHDMNLVMSISDRICVLDSGRIITIGTALQVKEHPEVQRVFLGAATHA